MESYYRAHIGPKAENKQTTKTKQNTTKTCLLELASEIHIQNTKNRPIPSMELSKSTTFPPWYKLVGRPK